MLSVVQLRRVCVVDRRWRLRLPRSCTMIGRLALLHHEFICEMPLCFDGPYIYIVQGGGRG